MEARIASRLADSDVSRLQEIDAPDYRAKFPSGWPTFTSVLLVK